MTRNLLRDFLSTTPFTDTPMILTASGTAPAFERPLFCYHVHKTGGNSVKHAIMQSLLHCPDVASGKLDKPIHFDDRNLHQTTPPDPFTKSYVNTHFKYGHHDAFTGDFRMFTLFRDPVRRLYSDYRYVSYRRGETVTLEGFREFITDPDNICRQCQHLSRADIRDVGADAIADDAEHTLKSLDAYATTERIEPFLQNLWIGYGYANVLAEKLNETANVPIDVDLTVCEDEIVDLNRREIEIYRHMRDEPKFMFQDQGWMTEQSPILASNTVVMLNGEIKNPDGTTVMSATALHMKTETVMAKLQSGAVNNVRGFENGY